MNRSRPSAVFALTTGLLLVPFGAKSTVLCTGFDTQEGANRCFDAVTEIFSVMNYSFCDSPPGAPPRVTVVPLKPEDCPVEDGEFRGQAKDCVSKVYDYCDDPCGCLTECKIIWRDDPNDCRSRADLAHELAHCNDAIHRITQQEGQCESGQSESQCIYGMNDEEVYAVRQQNAFQSRSPQPGCCLQTSYNRDRCSVPKPFKDSIVFDILDAGTSVLEIGGECNERAVRSGSFSDYLACERPQIGDSVATVIVTLEIDPARFYLEALTYSQQALNGAGATNRTQDAVPEARDILFTLKGAGSFRYTLIACPGCNYAFSVVLHGIETTGRVVHYEFGGNDVVPLNAGAYQLSYHSGTGGYEYNDKTVSFEPITYCPSGQPPNGGVFP